MRLLAVALLLAVGGCARPAAGPARAAAEQAPALVAVEVLRDGQRWTADFRFGEASPVWAFVRSPLTGQGRRSWRGLSWTVETPGVRLERQGHYDVLVADRGTVPERVRVRFTPFGSDVQASYDPALVFSDGSVALFSQQFDAFPVASAEAAARLPIDLNGTGIVRNATQVGFRDSAGQVLHEGRRYDEATMRGVTTYVLFGGRDPVVAETMTTVIDAQLPAWVRATLTERTPQIFARYAAELGPPPGTRPTVMVSWRGPTPGEAYMAGSVLPGLIAISYGGAGMLEPSPRVTNAGLVFIAHEAAHFWLGQAVRWEQSSDMWITEGGAELLAVRTVAALEPTFDGGPRLQELLDECVSLAANGSVASAQERGEHRAYYGCGAMFALVAEAAARRAGGGSFYSFVRTLIDANRTDRVLSRSEWLAELTRVSGDPSLARDIRAMLETRVADPAAALASLFTRAGVAHRRDGEGKLRLL